MQLLICCVWLIGIYAVAKVFRVVVTELCGC